MKNLKEETVTCKCNVIIIFQVGIAQNLLTFLLDKVAVRVKRVGVGWSSHHGWIILPVVTC